MKAIKSGIVVLVIGLLAVFATCDFCFARDMQSELGWPDVMEDDSNAPGTKLFGTLTVYYFNPTQPDGPFSLYFFLRLNKGNQQYGFSGTAEGSYSYTDWEAQKEAIKSFVEQKVVPKLFSCVAGSTCPRAVLKTVESYVDGDPLSFSPPCDECVGPRFAMMDITIAVQ